MIGHCLLKAAQTDAMASAYGFEPKPPMTVPMLLSPHGGLSPVLSGGPA